MSSTNRGAEREENDAYSTPGWATRALLGWLDQVLPRKEKSDFGVILDPGCGTGSITRELLDWGRSDMVMGVELDERVVESFKVKMGAHPRASTLIRIGDYLDPKWRAVHTKGVDLVVGNPPYKHALPFVRASLELPKRPVVAMLFRLNWAGGQVRGNFHRENRAAVRVLERRPSFKSGWRICKKTGKRVKVTSDSCEYGWFVWGTEASGTWDVLECEKIRRAPPRREG